MVICLFRSNFRYISYIMGANVLRRFLLHHKNIIWWDLSAIQKTENVYFYFAIVIISYKTHQKCIAINICTSTRASRPLINPDLTKGRSRAVKIQTRSKIWKWTKYRNGRTEAYQKIVIGGNWEDLKKTPFF